MPVDCMHFYFLFYHLFLLLVYDGCYDLIVDGKVAISSLFHPPSKNLQIFLQAIHIVHLISKILFKPTHVSHQFT